MGVLSDDLIPSRRSSGKSGEKFLRIYRGMAPDDQARIRRWFEADLGYTFILLKLHEANIDVGYSSVERGLWRLKESSWEC